MLQLSDRLRPLVDTAQIQFEVARAIGEHLGASRAGVAQMLPDDLTAEVTRNYTDGVRGLEGRHLVEDYSPSLLPSLRAGRTVARADIANDLDLSVAEKAAIIGIATGASVDVPLVKDGRLVAVLFMHHRHAHAWTSAELGLLEAVGARCWDAVDRARAETALRESEARLRMALDVAELGTWTWDLLTGHGDLDARGAEIVGLVPGNLTNVVEAQLASIHPADLAPVQNAVAVGIADGRPFDLAYRVHSPAGEIRSVASRARVICDGRRQSRPICRHSSSRAQA
ncbi:MAG: GAF domain-containing protein [bacterium]